MWEFSSAHIPERECKTPVSMQYDYLGQTKKTPNVFLVPILVFLTALCQRSLGIEVAPSLKINPSLHVGGIYTNLL